MKRLFFFAAATAVALSSCSKDEVTATAADAQNAISFSTYSANATKAIEDVDYTALKANGFTVTAINTSDDNKLLTDDATTNADGTTWTGTTAAYWPASDAVSFVAVGRTKDGAAKHELTIFTNSDGAKLAITTGTVGTGQEDIVIASAWEQTSSDGSTGNVTLTFKHALSKITTTVTPGTTNTNLTLKLTSITFNNLSISETATITKTDGIVWSTEGGTTDMSVELNSTATEGISGGASAANVMNTNGDLIIIPQTLGTVTIVGAWYDGTTRVSDVDGGPITLTYADGGSLTTAVNTAYTINFTITPKIPISFTVTEEVDSWGSNSDITGSAE